MEGEERKQRTAPKLQLVSRHGQARASAAPRREEGLSCSRKGINSISCWKPCCIPLGQIAGCPGFAEDRVNFLPTSRHAIVLWILSEDNVGALAVAGQFFHLGAEEFSAFQTALPARSWGGARRWVDTEPGRPTQTGQSNVPYCMAPG